MANFHLKIVSKAIKNLYFYKFNQPCFDFFSFFIKSIQIKLYYNVTVLQSEITLQHKNLHQRYYNQCSFHKITNFQPFDYTYYKDKCVNNNIQKLFLFRLICFWVTINLKLLKECKILSSCQICKNLNFSFGYILILFCYID